MWPTYDFEEEQWRDYLFPDETIPWGYQTPGALGGILPAVSATEPLGGLTRTVPQRASVMAPGWWSEIPPMGRSGTFENWMATRQPWQMTAPERTEEELAWDLYGPGGSIPPQSGVGYEMGPGQLGPQYPYGMGVAPGGGMVTGGGPAIPVPGYGAGTYGAGPAAVSAEAAERAGTYGPPEPIGQAPTQAAAKEQVRQRATTGLPTYDAAWAKEFQAEHGMTWQQYYDLPQHRRGEASALDALTRDWVREQQYKGITGKKSLTPGDWENIYYGVIPGRGGGAPPPPAVAPTPTPAPAVAPPYQVGALGYTGPRTRINIPEQALGEISALGRSAFEASLRAGGWAPTGVMGRYGYGEYARPEAAPVWFDPSWFDPYQGGQQARWLAGEFGWTPRIERGTW